MIKTIIKRNGEQEEFSPNKVNGWGEWAAKSLGNNVDWSAVVISAVNMCPAVCSSLTLQEKLIEVCLGLKTWEYNRMAGRLYADLIERVMYDTKVPTIKEVHSALFNDGIMVKLAYTDEDYAELEKVINHKQNLKYPHYQLNQLRNKYALRNKITGKEYESAQFVYMRMAMALAEDEKDKVYHASKWYDHFSKNRINAPTPNFVNLGTKLKGYASCCVYTTKDTAPSLATGDHIAYMMTCMSAGIGSHIKTRSIGDAVRGGLIQHQGKLPYYRSLVGAIQANLQNGRGGAATQHYGAFDPEAEVIQKLRHPMTPITKKIAGIHYSFGSNKFFARAVARDEELYSFSYADEPELFEAQYEKDHTRFETLYAEYAKSGKAKHKFNARELMLGAITQSYETGVHYLHQFDTMNTHTPFKDKIYSLNLCAEVALPTKGYDSVKDLYKETYEEGDGEIALCNLAGIVVSNIESDEQYADAVYYSLKMIDKTIQMSDYVFPNLAHTAKSRMNAGVGILGLAHLMAKKHLKYSTVEGRNFIHELSETHYWHLVNASLRLGKELGNAPWMHKTLWPDGWLPIDTYEKRVDSLITIENKRDWESLRALIKENKGIRNSVLSCHMPGESSTISSGTTNGLYPVREVSILKTSDTTNPNKWVAPDSTRLKNKYELSWDISSSDMIKVYAVVQKWTDQTISADLYAKVVGDTKIQSSTIVQDYLDMVRYGMKSRYYINSLISDGVKLDNIESAFDVKEEEVSTERGCAGGVCTL